MIPDLFITIFANRAASLFTLPAVKFGFRGLARRFWNRNTGE